MFLLVISIRGNRLQYPGRYVSRIEKRALGKLEEALGQEM